MLCLTLSNKKPKKNRIAKKCSILGFDHWDNLRGIRPNKQNARGVGSEGSLTGHAADGLVAAGGVPHEHRVVVRAAHEALPDNGMVRYVVPNPSR